MPLGFRGIVLTLVFTLIAGSSAAFAKPPKRSTTPTATVSATAASPEPTAPPSAAPSTIDAAPAMPTGTPTPVTAVNTVPTAPAATATPLMEDDAVSGSGPKKHAGSDGWSGFRDGWLLLDMILVLLLALLLGASIAYHPSIRRRHSTLEQFEQPKTLLMYAVVAAVVALIVQVQPTMAFVIFGIGGLLRFRTEVGEAKDTGRVILVTVVGLCCGLKIFIVAMPATLIGWLLIWALERQAAGTIRVSGVSEQSIQEAARAYRDRIQMAGCTVIAEHAKFIKREFEFVVKAPARFNRDAVQAEFDSLPPTLRGVVVWDGL